MNMVTKTKIDRLWFLCVKLLKCFVKVFCLEIIEEVFARNGSVLVAGYATKYFFSIKMSIGD